MAELRLLDRFIRNRKSIVMSPSALEGLRSMSQPPMAVYGSVSSEMISGGYGMLYRTQPAVQICVKFLARGIAQLNIKTYRRNSNEDRKELPDHPAALQLQRPNDYTTRYRMMFATIADLGIYENAFWLKMRRGDALALVRIPPDIVLIDGSQWVKPSGYTIVPNLMFGTESEIKVTPKDMIHFRGYDPLDSRMGLSPLLAIRDVLMEDQESRKFRRSYWRKAARMEGVIERPLDAPDWGEEARSRFRKDWQNAYAGETNSGATGILEDGMTFKPYSWSPKDSEWIAGRKLTLEEAAHAYHIPPSMIGLQSTGGPATNTIVEEHKMLYQDTFSPILEMIEEELQLSLLPEFDDISNVYFEFNLADKLKGSFEENATMLTTATGGPWLTRREARARMNLPDKGGDTDDLIVPMNVTTGGQPAPTVPTATPASPVPAADQATPPKSKSREQAAFMKAKRDGFITETTKVLADAFERQRNWVLGSKAINRNRWDSQLTSDLWTIGVKTAEFFGSDAAARIGGSYSEERTHAYILANCEMVAKGINDSTLEMLGTAEDRATVFEVAISSRAPQLAVDRVTWAMNWGVQEAAHQNGG